MSESLSVVIIPTIISGIFVVVGSIITVLFVTRKQADATKKQAYSEAQKRDAEIERIKDELTTSILARANDEIKNQRDKIAALEEAERRNSKVQVAYLVANQESSRKIQELEERLSLEISARLALEQDLRHERAARARLENNLVESNQRISALEDELDKSRAALKQRDDRITELEFINHQEQPHE